MIVGPCSERQIILSSIGKALNVPVDTIDTTKSFTEHGGHSLSAVEIQNECRGLVRRPPTVLSLLISPSIDEVLGPSDLLDITQDATKADTPDTSDSGFVEPPLSEEASNPSTPPSIHASTVVYDSAGDGDVRTTPPPMTLGDSGFWQSPPLDAGRTFGLTEAPATEMQTALILGGQSTIRYFETWRLEDVVVLKHAWTTVIRMEPIFRTCFQESASGSYVMRLQDSMIPWEEVITFDRQSYEAALAKQEPLSGPKFQFKTVIYSSPDRSQSEGTILFSVHHALLDGFSMSRLTHKVRCVAVGHTDINPGKSFLDAAQELYCIRKDSERQAVSFWARKATQFPTATTGLGIPRPKRRGIQEEPNEVNILFGDLADRLQDTSRALGVTVASFFHAAWALVQALYTDSDSIVVGTILSGRNLPIDYVDTVIGPLLNSLPLHVSVERKESTGNFVRRIFRDLAVLSCLQWSTSEHGFSRNFEAAISVTRGLQGPAEDPIRPIRESGYDFESNVPLSVAIDEVASSIRVVYHSNLYSRASVEGLASCFRNALESLTYPTSVQQCMDSLVTVPMQGQLRVLGNCLSGSTTRTAHREDLVFLFETAVRYHPKSTAVEIGQRSVTYSELDKLASRVSETLERLGVSGEVVCAHADGSLNWVVSLIGILKAGAIICSLDATLPADLRASMFNAAGSRVFMVGNETETCFKPPDCSHCLVVDTIVSTAPDATQQPTARMLTPGAPAYLCFTSGSTGTPKGVLCTHQGLAAFQKDLEVRLHAAPGVRISQFMSPAFDGSIHEIFSALCYGSTLVLRSSANPFDVLRLVDSAIMTPSVASTISPLHFQNLRTVYLVGEQVPMSVVEQWAPGRKLYNMYGPTEGTCGATITRLIPGQPVTIGRPNPTSRVYILSQSGRLMPRGAVGEIYIAGVQVSLGYLNLPQETTERFLPDSVCPNLGEKMYKTGDRGYWDEDGNVVCLGRNDRQIKLRGFRLDLDDLEARIANAFPGVKAVALAKAQDRAGLVAMVQPADLDPAALQAAVRARLPRQAVPSAMACVDSFPMTRAGKVDLKMVAAYFTAV